MRDIQKDGKECSAIDAIEGGSWFDKQPAVTKKLGKAGMNCRESSGGCKSWVLEVTEPFCRKPGLTRQWSNSAGLYILSVETQKAVLSSLTRQNTLY